MYAKTVWPYLLLAVLTTGCAAPIAPPPSAAAPVSESTPSETFVMPDLTGTNLQESQDRLQAMGSWLMDQEDASGRGRTQVIDSNWKVCSQDPAPGATTDPASTVTLRVVKLDEQCPPASDTVLTQAASACGLTDPDFIEDGHTLFLGTLGNPEDVAKDRVDLECVLRSLNIPDSLLTEMDATGDGMDGNGEWDGIRAHWSSDASLGLYVSLSVD